MSEGFFEFLKSPACGYTSPRDIGDGMYAALNQFMFTHAIIVGQIGDLTGYTDRWCYNTEAGARAALEAWDGTGEPYGWHRHPDSGRRRPGGDATKEYVAP